MPSGVQPRRRLCDAAVDAFAARLKLTLSFPLTPARRYAPEQLAEAPAGRRIMVAGPPKGGILLPPSG